MRMYMYAGAQYVTVEHEKAPRTRCFLFWKARRAVAGVTIYISNIWRIARARADMRGGAFPLYTHRTEQAGRCACAVCLSTFFINAGARQLRQHLAVERLGDASSGEGASAVVKRGAQSYALLLQHVNYGGALVRTCLPLCRAPRAVLSRSAVRLICRTLRELLQGALRAPREHRAVQQKRSDASACAWHAHHGAPETRARGYVYARRPLRGALQRGSSLEDPTQILDSAMGNEKRGCSFPQRERGR